MTLPLSPASTSSGTRIDPGNLGVLALFSRLNLLSVALAEDPTPVSFLSALDAVDLDFSRLSPDQGLFDSILPPLMANLRQAEIEALLRRGLDLSRHARRQAGGGLGPYHRVLGSDVVERGVRTEQEMKDFLFFLSRVPLSSEDLDDFQKHTFSASYSRTPTLYWQRLDYLHTLVDSQAVARTLDTSLPGANPDLDQTSPFTAGHRL